MSSGQEYHVKNIVNEPVEKKKKASVLSDHSFFLEYAYKARIPHWTINISVKYVGHIALINIPDTKYVSPKTAPSEWPNHFDMAITSNISSTDETNNKKIRI